MDTINYMTANTQLLYQTNNVSRNGSHLTTSSLVLKLYINSYLHFQAILTVCNAYVCDVVYAKHQRILSFLVKKNNEILYDNQFATLLQV